MTTLLEREHRPTAPDLSLLFTHGTSAPLGAIPGPEGTNFSVFSKHATGIDLLLFDRVDDGAHAARVIRIDPAANRTYHYWHVFVPGVKAGQLYGYRVEGPWDPANGMRFDPGKVLLDPYGRGVAVPDSYSRAAASEPADTSATAMKSVIVDPSAYDWEGDAPLRRPSAQTIIYEMHVRGFTRRPSSGVGENTRGTFAGLTKKIPYLKQLGITAVELLPVFQFDAQDCPPGKVNYWGYAPSRSSRRTRPTARAGIRSARWTSSATWSRRCTARASR
jgi:isoamylase